MKIHTPIMSLAEKAAQEGMRAAGKQVLKASNKNAPQDDGDLIKSGRVVIDDLSMQVSYTAVHAPLQHENLDWQHHEGGGPKFLERAAAEVDIEAIMAAKIRAAFGE